VDDSITLNISSDRIIGFKTTPTNQEYYLYALFLQ
jgi:hypothetical protein